MKTQIKSQNGGIYYDIALKFDKRLCTKAPMKFQSDWTILNKNLTASKDFYKERHNLINILLTVKLPHSVNKP